MPWCQLALLLTLAPPPAALTDDGLFPFVVPQAGAWDNVTNLGRLNAQPAGATGFVQVLDGHFADGAGQRLRFIGGALAFDANFPSHEGAEQLAARLQMLGFNLMRLHHMDMGTAPRGIWDPNFKDKQHLEAGQLDRLDYLIYQLKQHGVYVNLNLHVSRTLGEADGFPEAGKLPTFSKAVDNYLPRMIELQKQYAQDLLTHRNPYTKTRYVDEPAVAVVEINNENSLTTYVLKDQLADIPQRYRTPLETRWNAWLKDRYRSTAELREAWGAQHTEAGPELLANGDFTAETTGWMVQSSDLVTNEVRASGYNGKPCWRLGFGSVGRVAWSHQAHQQNLTFQPGELYTFKFAMRSERPASVTVSPRLDHAHPETGKFEPIGINCVAKVTPKWQTFEYTFVANHFAGPNCRVGFTFPNAQGTYELAALSLHRGGDIGLEQGHTLEQGNLPCPWSGAQLLGQRRDWFEFTSQVEMGYAQGMANYLKDELGVKVPVIDTQASYGESLGMRRESLSDYVDLHTYWQHPRYLDRGAPRRFEVLNTPLVASDGGTLRRGAVHRGLDKPFVVSELNNPWPSLYAAEMWPLEASFAALQDWDGLIVHNYLNYGSDAWEPGKANSYFDTATNPLKAVFVPAAVMLFREAAVAPVKLQLTLNLPDGAIVPALAAGNGTMDDFWDGAGLTAAALVTQRLATVIRPGDGDPKLDGRPTPDTPVVRSADGQLTWDRTDPEQPSWLVDTPRVKVAVGYFAGRDVKLGSVTIRIASTATGHAVVTVVSMDDQPLERSARILVSAAGRGMNSGQEWFEDGMSCRQNGTSPTVAEGVRGTVRITDGSATQAFALDGQGDRAKPAELGTAGGSVTLALDPALGTLWYEVSRE